MNRREFLGRMGAALLVALAVPASVLSGWEQPKETGFSRLTFKGAPFVFDPNGSNRIYFLSRTGPWVSDGGPFRRV
jgi:hypothetical protein